MTELRKAYLLAALAGADLRTVQKHFAGLPIRAAAAERIRKGEKRLDAAIKLTIDYQPDFESEGVA